MRHTLPLYLLFIFFTSVAQETRDLEKKYINETVYRYGSNFMKGTDRLRFADLQNEFERSPVGFESYRLAKKYKNISFGFRILSLAASIATISYAANNNRDKVYIGFGAQLLFGILGGQYSLLSNRQTDRALWQRNKDVLFGERK